jgi:hypothetical protein
MVPFNAKAVDPEIKVLPMSTTYEVTADKDSIIIRLPRQFTSQDTIIKLLDYLELDAIRQRSQLTAEDAETLSTEIKQGAWEQVKHLFSKKRIARTKL